MVSRRVLIAGAVILTIVALGAGAAAIPALDDTSSSGGTGDGEGGEPTTPNGGITLGLPGWVFTLIMVTLVLVAVVAFVLLPAERYRFLRNMAIVMLLGFLFLLVVELVDIPVSFDPEPLNETGEPGLPGDEGGGDGENGDGSGFDGPTSPLTALVALLVAGLLGAALFYRRATPESSEPTAPGENQVQEAVGRAAGRAAERIGDESLENAVYQAWHEMTAALAVPNAETRTPAEFEAAAIEAGLEPDDVGTLTDLFREIRYGDAPVTPEREQRARETLERIEAVYADIAAESGDPQ